MGAGVFRGGRLLEPDFDFSFGVFEVEDPARKQVGQSGKLRLNRVYRNSLGVDLAHDVARDELNQPPRASSRECHIHPFLAVAADANTEVLGFAARLASGSTTEQTSDPSVRTATHGLLLPCSLQCALIARGFTGGTGSFGVTSCLFHEFTKRAAADGTSPADFAEKSSTDWRFAFWPEDAEKPCGTLARALADGTAMGVPEALWQVIVLDLSEQLEAGISEERERGILLSMGPRKTYGAFASLLEHPLILRSAKESADPPPSVLGENRQELEDTHPPACIRGEGLSIQLQAVRPSQGVIPPRHSKARQRSGCRVRPGHPGKVDGAARMREPGLEECRKVVPWTKDDLDRLEKPGDDTRFRRMNEAFYQEGHR